MHDQAMDFIKRHATAAEVAVLDIGGQNINGSPREHFPNANPYVVLDVADGPGVDVVADAKTWEPNRSYDVVICAEVFEHVEQWPAILATAFAALRPGGKLIVTCAGPGRMTHSGRRESLDLDPGEWYRNVRPDDLLNELRKHHFSNIVVEVCGHDVRAHATRDQYPFPPRG